MFRLAQDRAVINRFGLNSEGLEVVRGRLAARQGRPGRVGVNIGANKESTDRLADYVTCTRALAPLVDFVTVNVSSPNTPGLRDLQGEAFLDELLARVVEARDATHPATAILLKIAPDITLDALDAMTATALRRGVQGLVVSNTTIARPETLREASLARETGGLSGRPLFAAATRLLAETYLRVGGKLPLVGVGGIDSAEAAWTKIRAGASLLQLYSSLVYAGPGLIPEIKAGLVQRMKAEGAPAARAPGRARCHRAGEADGLTGARGLEPPRQGQPHSGRLDGVEVPVGDAVRRLAGQARGVEVGDLVGLGVGQVQHVEGQADPVVEIVADPAVERARSGCERTELSSISGRGPK